MLVTAGSPVQLYLPPGFRVVTQNLIQKWGMLKVKRERQAQTNLEGELLSRLDGKALNHFPTDAQTQHLATNVKIFSDGSRQRAQYGVGRGLRCGWGGIHFGCGARGDASEFNLDVRPCDDGGGEVGKDPRTVSSSLEIQRRSSNLKLKRLPHRHTHLYRHRQPQASISSYLP